MGENKNKIFVIGSPDIDIMIKTLPNISEVKKMYGIKFSEYSIMIFHPVSTEFSKIDKQAEILIKSLKKSKRKYIVINPNNDLGSEFIFKKYSKLKKDKNFKIFESMRFEYFLTLLKNSKFIIGNSSAGIKEAQFYGIPAINIGTRQHNRFSSELIQNIKFNERKILNSIETTLKIRKRKKNSFLAEEKFFKVSKIILKIVFGKLKFKKVL